MAGRSGQVYVALLRAVNVAGRALLMKDLRPLFEALPAEDVSTYVQSGNVVFRSGIGTAPSVARAAEQQIRSRLGVDTVVIVRTANDLAKVVAGNPFLGGGRDEATLHVTFLATAADPDRVANLAAAAGAARPDEVRVVGHDAYVSCPDGYGRSKLNNAFIERKLGVAATTRNWRTVTTLREMARALGGDD
jgi:uncharacterized protein (DUF1697 family)